jgi:hypothetical protein
MHRWQGASGQWYVFNIYPISAVPDWISSCNYVLARPRFDAMQAREPFYFGESGDFRKEFGSHPKLWPAQLLGATEVQYTCWRSRDQSGSTSKPIYGEVIGHH